MDFPQFLAPQTKTIGGGEVREPCATASAAEDHSGGMYMFGDGFSGPEIEAIRVRVGLLCAFEVV